MIKPDKHTNLDTSVINVTAFVLTQFKRRPQIGYDELLSSIKKELSDSAAEMYPYAINFLYLLGKIEYQSDKDCFTINEA
jgi:hypothetical protein